MNFAEWLKNRRGQQTTKSKSISPRKGELTKSSSQAIGVANQQGRIPWDWSAKTPEDPESLLELLHDCLPGIFSEVSKQGSKSDLVVMLVDVEDIRWRGLLGLLCTHHCQPYYSPETVSRQEAQIERSPEGPFYRAPMIEGKRLRIGVYAVDRCALVDELCWIRGLPIPFIKQVRKAQTPKGMFTIVYFLKEHLGVRHMSSDASVCEAPKFSISDLM